MVTPSELTILDPTVTGDPFPNVAHALREPDGLLAVGGNLQPDLLVNAYRRGIFPWYSESQPILWWSPDPRAVLFPDDFRMSRSLRKTLRRNLFQVTLNQCFDEVMLACAARRPQHDGTWITQAMIDAYITLHQRALAHSVETWRDGELVGGLYGVAVGRVFFGESMFSRVSDASKVALVHLVDILRAGGFQLIDCQITSDHLQRMGVQQIPRAEFVQLLEKWCAKEPLPALARWGCGD